MELSARISDSGQRRQIKCVELSICSLSEVQTRFMSLTACIDQFPATEKFGASLCNKVAWNAHFLDFFAFFFLSFLSPAAFMFLKARNSSIKKAFMMRSLTSPAVNTPP